MFLIKASKARKITKKYEKFLKQEKLKELNILIKGAALSGRQKIDFYYFLDEDMIEVLERSGYTVNAITYTYFTISW